MLVSMSLALGGVARMRTRKLYNNIGDRRARRAWKKPLLLEEGAARELEFWLRSFDEFNGRPFLDNRKDLMVDVTGFSDASDKGFGGFVRLGEGARRGAVEQVVQRAERGSGGARLRSSMRGVLTRGLEFRGEFTEAQSARSSTWREAWGVLQLLRFSGFCLDWGFCLDCEHVVWVVVGWTGGSGAVFFHSFMSCSVHASCCVVSTPPHTAHHLN